jgi:hypothetical protein
MTPPARRSVQGWLTAAALPAVVILCARPAAGQTAADSAASAATGVYPAQSAAPDTAPPTRTPGAKQDSAAGRSAVPGQRVDTVVSTGPLVVNLAPPDTTLLRACEGATAGSSAPDLLAVAFRAGTVEREKAAAAKTVHGTLAGPTAEGEEYVRVPADGPALTVVADRLIREGPVTRVSLAPCPPPATQAAPALPAVAPTAPPPAAAPGATPPASDTTATTAPPTRGP